MSFQWSLHLIRDCFSLLLHYYTSSVIEYYVQLVTPTVELLLTATSLQWPSLYSGHTFSSQLRDSPLLNPLTMVTSPQWPVNYVPSVAIVATLQVATILVAVATRILELVTKIRTQVASSATKINMTYASGAWVDYHPERKEKRSEH